MGTYWERDEEVLDQLPVSVSIGTQNAFKTFPMQKCWTFCMVDLILSLSSSDVLELFEWRYGDIK